MDLKIKDVAELLSVSETTVRRWLNLGKIPAYRLNHQYRFSRIEIENWMMRCKLKPEIDPDSPFGETQIYPPVGEEQKVGTQQFSLYRALHQGEIFDQIAGSTKEELIRGTTQVIAERLNLDADVLAELLLDREELMPTALNNGIAVPHTRDFLMQGPFDMIFVVYPREPIPYGALDNQPVHTLFFLFACADKRHLHLLAKLAHLSSQLEALALLKTRPPKRKLLEFVRGWEAR